MFVETRCLIYWSWLSAWLNPNNETYLWGRLCPPQWSLTLWKAAINAWCGHLFYFPVWCLLVIKHSDLSVILNLLSAWSVCVLWFYRGAMQEITDVSSDKVLCQNEWKCKQRKKMHECIHKSNFALGQRHGRDWWVGFQKARQRAIKTHWERKEGLWVRGNRQEEAVEQHSDQY